MDHPPCRTDFVVLASGVVEILLGLAMLTLWKGIIGQVGDDGLNGFQLFVSPIAMEEVIGEESAVPVEELAAVFGPLRFWRMPSTSRAYPLPLSKKADAYRQLFLPKEGNRG